MSKKTFFKGLCPIHKHSKAPNRNYWGGQMLRHVHKVWYRSNKATGATPAKKGVLERAFGGDE